MLDGVYAVQQTSCSCCILQQRLSAEHRRGGQGTGQARYGKPQEAVQKHVVTTAGRKQHHFPLSIFIIHCRPDSDTLMEFALASAGFGREGFDSTALGASTLAATGRAGRAAVRVHQHSTGCSIGCTRFQGSLY